MTLKILLNCLLFAVVNNKNKRANDLTDNLCTISGCTYE